MHFRLILVHFCILSVLFILESHLLLHVDRMLLQSRILLTSAGVLYNLLDRGSSCNHLAIIGNFSATKLSIFATFSWIVVALKAKLMCFWISGVIVALVWGFECFLNCFIHPGIICNYIITLRFPIEGHFKLEGPHKKVFDNV